MQLAPKRIELNCAESDIYNRVLPLDHKHILELGCGGAEKTRDIATTGTGRQVTALEVSTGSRMKKTCRLSIYPM